MTKRYLGKTNRSSLELSERPREFTTKDTTTQRALMQNSLYEGQVFFKIRNLNFILD
jgi:hypothetical protein